MKRTLLSAVVFFACVGYAETKHRLDCEDILHRQCPKGSSPMFAKVEDGEQKQYLITGKNCPIFSQKIENLEEESGVFTTSVDETGRIHEQYLGVCTKGGCAREYAGLGFDDFFFVKKKEGLVCASTGRSKQILLGFKNRQPVEAVIEHGEYIERVVFKKTASN